MRVLYIDLRYRLPDINKMDDMPSDIRAYGRCAILQNNQYWFGSIYTSHPLNTKDGFYWALSKRSNYIYISSRGANINLSKLIDHSFILYLIENILDKRYSHYKKII